MRLCASASVCFCWWWWLFFVFFVGGCCPASFSWLWGSPSAPLMVARTRAKASLAFDPVHMSVGLTSQLQGSDVTVQITDTRRSQNQIMTVQNEISQERVCAQGPFYSLEQIAPTKMVSARCGHLTWALVVTKFRGNRLGVSCSRHHNKVLYTKFLRAPCRMHWLLLNATLTIPCQRRLSLLQNALVIAPLADILPMMI